MSTGQSKQDLRWLKRWTRRIPVMVFEVVMAVVTLPYCRVYRRGTRKMAEAILRSKNPEESERLIKRWARCKVREAQYVQVAGAVLITTVGSCLSSEALAKSHWSGPAFWYSSIVLGLSAIFTGAQQVLVLPGLENSKDDCDRNYRFDVKKIKHSLAGSEDDPGEASIYSLFAWQIPIMMLSYSVFSFITGLCAVVLSPLAQNVGWNSDAKIALVFAIFSIAALVSWVLPFYPIHGFDDLEGRPQATGPPDSGATARAEPLSTEDGYLVHAVYFNHSKPSGDV